MKLQKSAQGCSPVPHTMKRALAQFVLAGILTGLLLPSLQSMPTETDCVIIIGDHSYLNPGCDEQPDPSSPGLGI